MGLLDISIIRMVSKLVLVLLLFHHVVIANSSYSSQKQYPSCPDEEKSALLQFKDSFTIDKSASRSTDAYPKVTSWKPAEGGNSTCCLWEGVKCDEKTGHVIGLDLGSSCLHGSINSNSSIFRLVHLQRLNLSDNNFNYSQIPPSIRNFPSLTHLDLSTSVFSGRVPSELSLLSKLTYLNLALNLDRLSEDKDHQLSEEENYPLLKLEASDLGSLVQNLTSLEVLTLSFVNVSSVIPHSMANLSSLTTLHLRDCHLFGEFPTYNKGSSLRMIDVSHNKLQGQLPRSLANCAMLEFLVLSNNRFNDVFPIWLGTLLELKLLAMRHNGFYGVIGNSRKNVDFPKLRVLDLAYNDFTGAVPSMFPNITVNKSTYMNLDVGYDVDGFPVFSNVAYQLMIATKGLEQYYPKIREEFASFDISSNKFEGKIPEFIGNIKDLRSLNLSHNILTGSIPSSFGNLMKLESLDLSQNKLSGRIPQQLVQLNFLSSFNVSHNNLTGAIPQGTQLTSLNVTSYDGNPGLCGDPLPKKCGNPKAPELPPSTVDEGDSSSEGIFELDWKIVSAGCGSGLVVGVVLADVVITRRPDLFLKIVGMIRQMIRKT
ncbi:hypothetical protein ACFX2G_041322 [Malus domestica]